MRRFKVLQITSIFGAVFLLLATGMAYYLEVAETTLSRLWDFCYKANLPLLLAGLVALYVGLIGLARNFSASRCLQSAGACICPVIAIALVEAMGFRFLNVHGWSMIPLISGILLLPLGLVLAIMAAARRGKA
jgi:predicted permease